MAYEHVAMNPSQILNDAAIGSEYALLYEELSFKRPSVKEIESTQPGQPSISVERRLPSFFDSYPRCKAAAEELIAASKPHDAVELLRCAKASLATGDLAPMDERIAHALGLGEDAAPSRDVLDLSSNEADSVTYRWQVDGGDAGWLDFDDACTQLVEQALASQQPSVEYTGHSGQRYHLDFQLNAQTNLRTHMYRPVRRVPRS